ncbi:MAG: DUF86 domain-containing protein [Lachnospiraceae bacterium]|nr:DUF86 domain-containing protein [Lachnospiraceae bacterium]
MDNIKDDQYYSDKMIRDVSFIRRHMQGLTYDVFIEDEILQDSMMFRLIQISENAKKLTDAFRAGKPEVPWSDVYGLRNKIVHEYGGLDLKIVYDTLSNDIPALLRSLSAS